MTDKGTSTRVYIRQTRWFGWRVCVNNIFERERPCEWPAKTKNVIIKTAETKILCAINFYIEFDKEIVRPLESTSNITLKTSYESLS